MEDKIMVGRRKDAGARSYLAQEMQDGSMDSKKNGQHAFGKHIAQCSCGGRTRTCDLQVMSLASYQLLHSAMLFLICECKGTAFIWIVQILGRLFSNYPNK